MCQTLHVFVPQVIKSCGGKDPVYCEMRDGAAAVVFSTSYPSKAKACISKVLPQVSYHPATPH